ncbi:hypothetical protein L6452_13192 [Arctium lappa]|uniref:Uncharacterized protein n=1 Tax=Arctium lappa TaxID=4217 RepID=A0ACB9CHW9_ARCLA|nr:hypothetical protein L6452_13192 [Arctium lappa]
MDATKENDRIKALQVLVKKDRDIPSSSLPQVIGNMKKLRWIFLIEYPATSFSSEFQPMELCFLQLLGGLVEQLWEGYKHLPNLKGIAIHASGKCR